MDTDGLVTFPLSVDETDIHLGNCRAGDSNVSRDNHGSPTVPSGDTNNVSRAYTVPPSQAPDLILITSVGPILFPLPRHRI